ncbi:MAG: hypothetical protein H6553_06675 [Chitinophagales bacterium]|nr:hypothetical protein [Chitinophagales bacterium]
MSEKEFLSKWASKVKISITTEDGKTVAFQIFDKTNNKLIGIYKTGSADALAIDVDLQKYFDKKEKEKKQKDWLKIIALVVVVFLIYKFFNRKKR